MSENKLRLTTFTEIELLEKLDRAYRRIDELERKNSAGDTLATDLVTEVDDLRARLEQAEATKDAAMAHGAAMEARVQELEAENRSLDLSNERILKDLNRFIEVEDRLAAYEAAEEQLGMARRELDAAIAERDRYKKELESLDEPRNMTVEISELKYMLEQARTERDQERQSAQLDRNRLLVMVEDAEMRLTAARQKGAEALKPWLLHKEECFLIPHAHKTHERCTCGLREALGKEN